MTLDGRKAKLVLIALAVSLIANIFAVSFFVGRMSVGGMRAGEARSGYPPAIRAEMRHELETRRGDMMAARRQLRDARAAMFEAARAPTFDEAALTAAMAEVRTATAALQKVTQDALVETLKKMPAEERAGIRRPRNLRARD